jgi:hypothetical protein
LTRLPAPPATSCSSRRIALANWLWKIALRWLTSACTNVFASWAAPFGEVSSAVTATTSLPATTWASTASSSDWLERLSASCARTASTICGAWSSAATLAAAVRLPPVSRSTSIPTNVESDGFTGATSSCAVARYRCGEVSP